MRLLSVVVVLLLAPIVSAIGDLSVYAEASYSSQEQAPVLVEWFHGDNDSSQVGELEQMDRDGEITLLHWRTGADEDGGGLPDDDANSRMMYHSINGTPNIAIDGYPDSLENLDTTIKENEVLIDWNIQLIGSSEVELINITATWTNPRTLNGATQVHVFIIETEAVDDRGREVGNLVRDWATSSSFYFTNNTTNHWNSTITADHLEGAGIEIGTAEHADKYEVMIVMIGGFNDSTDNRVLSLQRSTLPTSWQSASDQAPYTPFFILLFLVICIGFIVLAERTREIGLPRLEGSWSSDLKSIEYRLITGNPLEIGDLKMGEGWSANGRIKKERIPGKTTHSGTLRVRGEGDFSMRLAVKVENLGDWILDLDLKHPESND